MPAAMYAIVGVPPSSYASSGFAPSGYAPSGLLIASPSWQPFSPTPFPSQEKLAWAKVAGSGLVPTSGGGECGKVACVAIRNDRRPDSIGGKLLRGIFSGMVFSSCVSFYNNEPAADAGDSAAPPTGESDDSS